MMRAQVLALAVLGMACGLGVSASGQDFVPGWIAEVKGNPDVFGVAAYYKPASRVQVGAEVSYWDGLKEGQHQAVSFEVVAKYFALDSQPLNLMIATVDTSAYVGLGLGGEAAKDKDLDDIADIRTGFVFGDGPVRLGVMYEYVMTDLMWSGAQNGEHRVLGTIAYEFGGKK